MIKKENVRLTITLSNNLYKKLIQISKKEHRSKSEVLSKYIDDYILNTK